MHKCAIAECDKFIGDEFLMCGPHWRKVPSPIQREVYATWRTFSNHDGRDRDALIRAEQAYRAARSKAIESVKG